MTDEVKPRSILQAGFSDLRLPPLPDASEPDPADYDPLSIPAWTPLMAIVWISTREVQAVRAVWPRWRHECGFSPVTLTHAAFQCAKYLGEDGKAGSLIRAETQLVADLWEGKVSASADQGAIAKGEWERLRFFGERHDDADRETSPGARAFTSVRISRDELVEAFPKTPAPIAAPRGRKKGAGSKDDSAPLSAIYAIKEKGGETADAITEWATRLAKSGTSREVDTIRRRLYRKIAKHLAK